MHSRNLPLPRTLFPFLLASALAACSGHGGPTSGRSVSFAGDTVVVTVPDRPDAQIGANGDLRIDNRTVALDPSQRDLLKRYHDQVFAVRDDGIAEGRQGAALGLHAIGTVVNNLVAGTPDKIDQDMEARGKTVEVAGDRMCSDLARLKATQDEVTAQLPDFRPFAVFGNGLSYSGGDMQCDDEHPPAPPEPPTPPVPPQPPQAPSSSPPGAH
jgi:hypothetical protein